jgi:hypothetical protein
MKKLLLTGIAFVLMVTSAHAVGEKEFCLRKGELPPGELKKCIAFWRCVTDREAGKVKHCYENDRRWK